MKRFRLIYVVGKVIFLACILSAINCSFCYAQTSSVTEELLKIKALSDSSIKKYPAEKVYLQLDKPYYATDDTIWLKAYLFNAPTLLFSAKSGLLHIDLISDSGKLVKQYVIAMKNGVGWGNISLDSTDFKTGTYTLRAYTNWMRNFGDAGFFYKQFYIAGRGENSWLVTSQASVSTENGKYKVASKLQFTDINKTPFANMPMQLKVYAGVKNWYKQNIRTDENGLLDINFTLPERSSNLAIVAESVQGNQKAIIPLNLNRTDKADVQFLPEGGNLIAGLPATIAFKAIGENGKGLNISGIIADHNGQQVAAFQSLHNGMGRFKLNVENNESYVAKVTLPDGIVRDYPLPLVKNSGTTLQVRNALESDSVEVAVAATNDMVKVGNTYFLIGKARGVICYAADFNFHNSNYLRKKIAKSLFPSGITHLILTDASGQPLNERLTYIDHHDNLRIELAPNKSNYASRDSIALQLKVTDNSGKPVEGNFSIAVTDDEQVTMDSLHEDNILSRLLLTSDLKGYIEKPGYYFQKQDDQTWQSLDDLLLTQGWVNYELPTDKQQTTYAAEKDFSVNGQVLNAFNGKVKATHVQLVSKLPLIAKDTVTDKNGQFTFNNFPRIDTPAFLLRAVNRNGKSFNVGIKMDEITVPALAMNYPASTPWYVNSDAAIIKYARNKDSAIKLLNNPVAGAHNLREVKILARKTIKDSQNLNGPGNADLVLDEKEIEKAGKKSWMQLFEERIDGFKQGFFNKNFTNMFSPDMDDSLFRYTYFPETNLSERPEWYFVREKAVILIVDGISFREDFHGFTNYLNFHNAEDIKGIELNSSWKYTSKYKTRFIPPNLEAHFDPIKMDFVFIEITTRSGHGPVIVNTPGTYLYKPLPLSWPKEFYKPKYTVNDSTKHFLPDLRSTINWEPDITTDKNGMATVSFYSADNPASYTVIIEGSDGNGNLGYQSQKININKRKEAIKSK